MNTAQPRKHTKYDTTKLSQLPGRVRGPSSFLLVVVAAGFPVGKPAFGGQSLNKGT